MLRGCMTDARRAGLPLTPLCHSCCLKSVTSIVSVSEVHCWSRSKKRERQTVGSPLSGVLPGLVAGWRSISNRTISAACSRGRPHGRTAIRRGWGSPAGPSTCPNVGTLLSPAGRWPPEARGPFPASRGPRMGPVGRITHARALHWATRRHERPEEVTDRGA